MGIRIEVGEREPIALAMRRLRKSLMLSGVGHEVRRTQNYAKPSEIRRWKVFQKWYKSRQETLRAKRAGEQ